MKLPGQAVSELRHFFNCFKRHNSRSGLDRLGIGGRGISFQKAAEARQQEIERRNALGSVNAAATC
jgi:hypothetical protein